MIGVVTHHLTRLRHHLHLLPRRQMVRPQLQADRRRRNGRSVRCVCSIRGTVVDKEETDTVNEISVAKQ